MNRRNSYIRSFNWKKSIKIICWIFAWLIIFDVSIHVFLNKKIKSLDDYFNYGLSTEAKIKALLNKPIPKNSILYAGWLNYETYKDRPKDVDIVFYGMSFTNNIAQELNKIEPRFKIRKIDGPGASLSHSYTAYQLDKNQHSAKIIILGILASSLKFIKAMTNDTIGVDFTQPCNYPLYKISNEQLIRIDPLINSFDDLKSAINNKKLWEKHLKHLKTYDSFYSSLLYKANILDLSIIGKIVKRHFILKHNQTMTNHIHDENGFKDKIVIDVLKKICINFIKDVRKNKKIPVFILINDMGYYDHLDKIIVETLKENNSAFITTSNICPSTNINNFISDGHFKPECDKKIAVKLNAIIENISYKK